MKTIKLTNFRSGVLRRIDGMQSRGGVVTGVVIITPDGKVAYIDETGQIEWAPDDGANEKS